MSTIGIDISTFKIAIVTLYKTRFDAIELTSRSSSWEERFSSLTKEFNSYVKKNISSSDDIFIEDIPFVRNKQSYFKLAHFLSMCRTVLTLNNLNVSYVHNSTWKKVVGIQGVGKKERVDIKDAARQKAIELFGEEKITPLSEDVVDALLIAKYGQLL